MKFIISCLIILGGIAIAYFLFKSDYSIAACIVALAALYFGGKFGKN